MAGMLSVQDIMMLAGVAWTVGRAFTGGKKGAPAEFLEVKRQAEGLGKSLDLLADVLTSDGDVLAKADEKLQEGVGTILDSAATTLRDLESLIERYTILSKVRTSSGFFVEKSWRDTVLANYKTIMWTTEKGDINALRQMLKMHADTILLTMQALQSKSMARLERTVMPMADKVDDIHSTVNGPLTEKVDDVHRVIMSLVNSTPSVRPLELEGAPNRPAITNPTEQRYLLTPPITSQSSPEDFRIPPDTSGRSDSAEMANFLPSRSLRTSEPSSEWSTRSSRGSVPLTESSYASRSSRGSMPLTESSYASARSSRATQSPPPSTPTSPFTFGRRKTSERSPQLGSLPFEAPLGGNNPLPVSAFENTDELRQYLPEPAESHYTKHEQAIVESPIASPESDESLPPLMREDSETLPPPALGFSPPLPQRWQTTSSSASSPTIRAQQASSPATSPTITSNPLFSAISAPIILSVPATPQSIVHKSVSNPNPIPPSRSTSPTTFRTHARMRSNTTTSSNNDATILKAQQQAFEKQLFRNSAKLFDGLGTLVEYTQVNPDQTDARYATELVSAATSCRICVVRRRENLPHGSGATFATSIWAFADDNSVRLQHKLSEHNDTIPFASVFQPEKVSVDGDISLVYHGPVFGTKPEREVKTGWVNYILSTAAAAEGLQSAVFGRGLVACFCTEKTTVLHEGLLAPFSLQEQMAGIETLRLFEEDGLAYPGAAGGVLALMHLSASYGDGWVRWWINDCSDGGGMRVKSEAWRSVRVKGVQVQVIKVKEVRELRGLGRRDSVAATPGPAWKASESKIGGMRIEFGSEEEKKRFLITVNQIQERMVVLPPVPS